MVQRFFSPHGFPGFWDSIPKRYKGVHFVDLGESFPTHIFLQNLASMQLRTSPVKFACSPRTDPPGIGFVILAAFLYGPPDVVFVYNNVAECLFRSAQWFPRTIEECFARFSATLNTEIRGVCKKFMQEPHEIFVDDEAKLTLHGLLQYYCKLSESEKNRKVNDLLDSLEFNQVLFFSEF